MLHHLDLRLFKCFEQLSLPLSPLTVLSGANGSGKSSVFQALVLLNQTIRDHEWSSRLILNGSVLRGGTVGDIVDKVHGRRGFGIALSDESHRGEWWFSGDRSDMSMTVDRVEIDGEVREQPESLRYLVPSDMADSLDSLSSKIRRLSYVTAERLGPREVYGIEDLQTASVVGPVGEHTASVLFWGRDESVMEELVLPGAPPTRLRQVERRMQSFFPGCGLVVSQVPNANAVTLGIRTSTDTDFHRPTHVGFGFTQILPIVVAGLSAIKGDLLLIENPEVHLHPVGQAMIGQFLSDLADSGIQVLTETHSDHVLNGIRRAVRSGRISAESVGIYFFQQTPEVGVTVVSPAIDDEGRLDSWPTGFFDQMEKDTTFLAGWEY